MRKTEFRSKGHFKTEMLRFAIGQVNSWCSGRDMLLPKIANMPAPDHSNLEDYLATTGHGYFS
jgi:hypothetical protein